MITKEQNLDRRLVELKKYVANERDIITDKAFGKDFNQVGYLQLRDTLLRSVDTLVVKELDRLGRDMNMIKEECTTLLRIAVLTNI